MAPNFSSEGLSNEIFAFLVAEMSLFIFVTDQRDFKEQFCFINIIGI